MPDLIFEDSRLVSIYDDLDGARNDLDHYLNIAREMNAKSILDVGSGTGCFAILASSRGYQVTAIEPAKASLDCARAKLNSEKIQWILGTAANIPPMAADLAVMTGNVAQVFIDDRDFETTLQSIRKALSPQGRLVFEVRDPAQRAWLEWSREMTFNRKHIPHFGDVLSWCEVTGISGELVSFRWSYVFEASGEIIHSDSTIRFRKREAIEQFLEAAGYKICEVRDAPDRPRKELVFIATPHSNLRPRD